MTDLAEQERQDEPDAERPMVRELPLVRRREPPQLSESWSLRRSLTVLGAIAVVVAIFMITAGAFALQNLADARGRVVGKIYPAFRQAEALQLALVDQETGVRGYEQGKTDAFLLPFQIGNRNEATAVRTLSAVADDPDLAIRTELTRIEDRAAAWRTQYANPTIAQVRAGAPITVDPALGKQLFDDVRTALTALQNKLDRDSLDANGDLDSAARRLLQVGITLAVALIVLLVALTVGLRRLVDRPIAELAGEVRRVADGDFEAEVHGFGPREVVHLGTDVEAMRRQIVAEFHALRDATDRLNKQTADLERSNTELEQFAYVASHDLQEPLRKVASFTQLLERRYKGQLDERADQYIAFAVDGAKRMQVLINDLLSFSRVGRLTREHVEINAGELVAQALANLSVAIEETGSTVVVAEDMPRVKVDQSLLVGVFQNLIGNAIKFRGDVPPEITVGVREDGEFWEFSIADNGIGIEPEYADRIFVIFQRLHPKDAYPGTGIGLAMCRKIVEYHGGQIWLDTDVPSGTTFRFTLPKIDTDTDTETDAESA